MLCDCFWLYDFFVFIVVLMTEVCSLSLLFAFPTLLVPNLRLLADLVCCLLLGVYRMGAYLCNLLVSLYYALLSYNPDDLLLFILNDTLFCQL